MAIDKDFVIKNGIEVNEDLLYGDAETKRVGIGLTTPGEKLEVIGNSVFTGIASAGLAVTTHDAYFTGFCTAIEGFNIGIGGTVFNLDAIDKKVGINSDIPQYTTDIRGPVSTGTTALFVFGDVEVTGNITGAQLIGQIQDGGEVGFSTVNVSATLNAPDSDVYTLFEVEETGGNQWEFVVGGAPPAGIGFTENTIQPTLYLQRGKKYQFDVNAPGFPFFIKTQPGSGTGNQYLDGVEGNGPQVGVVTFAVPYNAPPQLFYQASNRPNMNGLMNIVGIFTGFSDNLEVPGIATITRLDSTWLNVTGFSTLGGAGASATQFEVTGFTTLANMSAGGINATGIITASQFVGLARSAQTLQVQERNNNQAYQVGFVTANGASAQQFYIDSDDAQLSYNPSSNTLSVDTIFATLRGVADKAMATQVDERNNNQNYQVGFVTANGNTFQEIFIDTDNTNFTYNPSTHTVTAATFVGNLNGTATNATNINTQNDSTNAAQFIVFVADATDGTDNRPRVDNNLQYNPSTNLLSTGAFNGNGAALTNLNASNLASGTVPGDRGVTAGSAESSFVEYNGTTKTAGQFYGGTGDPDQTTRLNYDGNLHATTFVGPLTGNASSATQVNVTENDTDTGSVLFATGTGNQSVLSDNDLQFNANTNQLTVNSGTVNCTGDGSVFGDTTIDALEADSLNVTDNTASTSNTTGAIRCAGGVGIVGDLNVGGDITAFALSDERLKDNIQPIDNALNKVLSISGNTFDWNEQSSRSGPECGVIAQEIEKLNLPGLVTTRDDGHKAVRYEKLVPLLIEAIKDLSDRVKELEK